MSSIISPAYVAYRDYLLAREARDGLAFEEEPAGCAIRHWTAPDVERATGGRWSAPPAREWSASGLCIAPLTMRPGDMVAVRLAEGEVGVSEAWLARLPHPPAALIANDGEASAALEGDRLAVGNVSASILALGAYARERMTGKVLAVTGKRGQDNRGRDAGPCAEGLRTGRPDAPQCQSAARHRVEPRLDPVGHAAYRARTRDRPDGA